MELQETRERDERPEGAAEQHHQGDIIICAHVIRQV